MSRESLTIRRVPIDSLHNDPANARLHDDRNLNDIAASLKTFGQVEPLVVQKGTNKVIGGNGRLVAMRSMGLAECDVVEIDIDNVTAAGLSIALNRTGETSTWDFQALSETVKALQESQFDISVLGWADHELEPILAADWSPPEPGEMPGLDGESGGEGDGETGDDDGYTVRFSAEAWATVEQAIAHRRGDDDLTDAQVLEMICAEFLTAPA